jgi:hypothetical protein
VVAVPVIEHALISIGTKRYPLVIPGYLRIIGLETAMHNDYIRWGSVVRNRTVDGYLALESCLEILVVVINAYLDC